MIRHRLARAFRRLADRLDPPASVTLASPVSVTWRSWSQGWGTYQPNQIGPNSPTITYQ
jgi:hypothetical protein